MTIREQIQLEEKNTLSPYATLAENSKGREVAIEPCALRTNFQRDRDRILHCNSFRRLMYKTQVFLRPTGDHYRTRLTHTLEVSQVARTIARALRLNEDLTEAIALGHDLGHTPFGHTGEYVLNQLNPDGYHHGKQSVRLVEVLENHGTGLNLTWEVRDGIACHSSGESAKTHEGQIVRYADKIAYLNHDIDDAIRADVLSEEDLPLNVKLLLGRTKSRRLTALIADLVKNSGEEIKMSTDIQSAFDELKAFMFVAVYNNPVAKGEESRARRVVTQLYDYYLAAPEELPDFYQRIAEIQGPHTGICDYLSGMSDRFCVTHYEDLFVPKPWEV